jgi:hypothetical protein
MRQIKCFRPIGFCVGVVTAPGMKFIADCYGRYGSSCSLFPSTVIDVNVSVELTVTADQFHACSTTRNSTC